MNVTMPVRYNAGYRVELTPSGGVFGPCAGLSRAEMRARVMALEAELSKLPQLEQDLHHHFSDGVYARELRLPAGTVATGKTHRHAHLSFLLKGDISVLTEEGVKRLQGPAIVPANAGIKRAVYTHTDTVWVTIHATTETDLDEIERQVIQPDRPAIEQESKLCLGQQQ